MKLSSWYESSDLIEARKVYPLLDDKIVLGEILSINDEQQQIFISFPALLSHCWKNVAFLSEKYVLNSIGHHSILTLAEYFAAERKVLHRNAVCQEARVLRSKSN